MPIHADMPQSSPAAEEARKEHSFDSLPDSNPALDRGAHRIVIVGAGAGGLELATALGRRWGGSTTASVTLVDKSRVHVWKPLLHEFASGARTISNSGVELISHAKRKGYRYRIGSLVGLNRGRRRIHVGPTFDNDGRQIIPRRAIGYDTLVLAVGSVCNDFGVQGAADHAIALDSAEAALRFNRRMIDACLRANAQYEPLRPGQLQCAIVGAGATGVELAAELHKAMAELAAHNLDNINFKDLVQITIFEAGSRLLPGHTEHIVQVTQAELVKLGIKLRVKARVCSVREDGLLLDSGEFFPAEMVVWAAGIKAPDELARLDGLEVDSVNRVQVRGTLQAKSDDNVFAIGDCAAYLNPETKSYVPPRAQVAHQQARLLVQSLAARIADKPLPEFRYRDYGALVSLADYQTAAQIFGRVRLQGLAARIMYRSLYKKHQLAVNGSLKTLFDTIGMAFTRHGEARIKLH